jgi:acetyltransferase EpsM
MKRQYCIYGASGHSKVIIEIIEKREDCVRILYDEDSKKKLLFTYPVTCDRSVIKLENVEWLIGIGNNEIRKKISEENTLDYGRAIHPSANISKRVKIGKGTVIMGGVTINSETLIGNHCIVNTNASIDHDCFLGNFVHVSPNVALCGGIEIGEGTHLGAGTIVIPGIKIGKWSVIGAGSIIIRDIPDNVKVIGNPGRIIEDLDTK